MTPDLVLCLGNDVLCDDTLGALVAARARDRLADHDDVEVVFAPLAGFALLDLLNKRRRVLVVDTIQTGKKLPGAIHRFALESDQSDAPTRHLTGSHQISLPTALELGRTMGYSMPERIEVIAVEAQDVTTLSERPTPEVAAAVDGVLALVEHCFATAEPIAD